MNINPSPIRLNDQANRGVFRRRTINMTWQGFLLERLAKIFPSLGYYDHKVVVTFGMTNKNGVVGHDEYARMFGTARELFGLKMFPAFKEVVGVVYLLKTVCAEYREMKAFRFGDKLKLRMSVREVGKAGFILEALYLNSETMEVCAAGRQKIAYVGMDGKPRQIPPDIMCLLAAAKKSDSFFDTRCGAVKINGEIPIYQRRYDIANCMTNAEGNVSHDELVRLFASISEFYFLEEREVPRIDISNAAYSYFGDIFFGESMSFSLCLVRESGDEFEILISCTDDKGRVRAAAKQSIRI